MNVICVSGKLFCSIESSFLAAKLLLWWIYLRLAPLFPLWWEGGFLYNCMATVVVLLPLRFWRRALFFKGVQVILRARNQYFTSIFDDGFDICICKLFRVLSVNPNLAPASLFIFSIPFPTSFFLFECIWAAKLNLFSNTTPRYLIRCSSGRWFFDVYLQSLLS